MLEGFTEFRDALKSGQPLAERFTMRTVDIDLVRLQPPAYDSSDVKRIREMLGASQAIFARLLGVKPKTVQSWEQGLTPPGMACRLLGLFEKDAESWRKTLRSAMNETVEGGC